MAAAVAQTPQMPEVTVPLGKPQGDFRVYEESGGVYEHYKAMRENQSLAFAQRMTAQWGAFGSRPGGRMTVLQALRLCDTFVDRSDPDTLMPNSIHMLQAAEACRAAGKPEWFQLCALLHDIGKLMYKWGRCEDGQGGKATDPQWALGGDTWVVGAPIPPCAVYPKLSALSPDRDAAFQATPNGLYAPGCGMMNLSYAFGHDEYAWLWARHNKVQLPAEGLAILRLHSCYPWHTGKAYRELMAPGDEALEAAVIEFNQVRRPRLRSARLCFCLCFCCSPLALTLTPRRPPCYWRSTTCTPRPAQCPCWRSAGRTTRPSLTSCARASWTGREARKRRGGSGTGHRLSRGCMRWHSSKKKC
jgi:inositol oxygenase